MMKHFVKCSLQTYFCLFPKKLKTNKQLNSGRCRGSKEDTKEITPHQHLHSWNSTAGSPPVVLLETSLRSTVTCFYVHLMVVVWSPWFGIRSGLHPSNNPVHNSKPNGLQTTNEALADTSFLQGTGRISKKSASTNKPL